MAFPAFGTTVPSLSPYQFSWLGYVFGASTVFELTKIEGIDLPTVRTGDVGRPREHGLFIGLDVLGGREVTITGQLRRDATSFQHAWQQLAAATVPGGSVESPLFLNLPGYGTLATMTRVRRRSMPVDIQFVLGELADVVLQFASADPRWYATTSAESVTPPILTNGFKFPLTFNFSFGGGSFAGAVAITNNGNIETKPLLIVEGPCTNPSITNANTGANLTFGSKAAPLVMASGDKLVIDTDLHTATYYVSGSNIGASRLYTLAAGSQWFSLPPGTTTLQFLAAGSEGSLTVQYASAYLI